MIKLKELRKQKNITLEEFAKVINVSKATVNSYELHKTEPTLDTLVKIAKYFNVTTDYLLGIDNEVVNNELDKELLSYTNQLNDLEKAKVIGYAKSRVEQQKENKYNDLKNKLEG